MVEYFCGIRTIPLPAHRVRGGNHSAPDTWRDRPFASPWYLRRVDRDVSSLSRETVVDEPMRNLFTIYGGKFTTYRSLCERVGMLIATHLGRSTQSGTSMKENWFLDELKQAEPELFRVDSSLRHQ